MKVPFSHPDPTLHLQRKDWPVPSILSAYSFLTILSECYLMVWPFGLLTLPEEGGDLIEPEGSCIATS